MGLYASVITWLLIAASVAQYVMRDNWQAAMYFLVGAGFYALWNVARNVNTSYNNCNFVFSNENDKNSKQE